MKKIQNKLFSFAIALFLVSFILGFSGCNGGNCNGCAGLLSFFENNNSMQNEQNVIHEDDTHKWGSQEVIQETTCVRDGIVKYKCSCGEEKTEVVKANGHTYTEWENVTSATCFVNGQQKRSCTVCFEEFSQSIPKTEHLYKETEKITVNGVEQVTYLCLICEDTFTLKNLVLDTEILGEQYVSDCAPDFSFEVICAEDEAYIKENLKIIDAYFDDSDYEKHEKAVCDYIITAIDENVWQISPTEDYKKGYTYKAKRSKAVVFKDYGVQDLAFTIAEEEKNNVKLQEGLIFLRALENQMPGYYPSSIEYSENSDTYWLLVEKADGLFVGDIICVGSATTVNEFLRSTTIDDNICLKIENISIVGENEILLETKTPLLSEIYAELSVNSSQITLDMNEDELNALGEHALESFISSDDYIEFVAATYETTATYLNANNLKSSKSNLKKFFESITVEADLPEKDDGDNLTSFNVGLRINGGISVDVQSSSGLDLGEIKISFNAGMNFQFDIFAGVDIWFIRAEIGEEAAEKLKDEEYDLLAKVVQTTMTEFHFKIEMNLGDEENKKFEAVLEQKIGSGDLDETIAQIKQMTQGLLDGNNEERKEILGFPFQISVGFVFAIEIKLELYFQFELEAALSYDYKVQKVDEYGFKIVGEDVYPLKKQGDPTTINNDILAIGHIYVESGAKGTFGFVIKGVPSEKLFVGLGLKFGIWADADGTLDWSFVEENEKDNVVKGELKTGIVYDFYGEYIVKDLPLVKDMQDNVSFYGNRVELWSISGSYLPDDGADSSGGSSDGSGSGPNHEHDYKLISTQDIEVSCVEEWVRVYFYECTCGSENSISEWMPPLEHNYENNVCANCGEFLGSQGLEYTLSKDGKSYSVMGIGSCIDVEVVIPEIYQELPVKSIGGTAFRGCNSLISIIIPNSVTSIGSFVFSDCDNLVSVKLPHGLTSIAHSMFLSCDSLKNITIPDSVTSIEMQAFHSCSSLESIRIPDKVTSIGSSSFYNCSSLKSIMIGESVASISNAFYGCNSLGTITVSEKNIKYHSKDNCLIETLNNGLILGCKNSIIPGYVASIKGGAFQGCSTLTNMEIPNSVTSVEGNAFYKCTSLKSIVIPDGVTSIGYGAFSGCVSLQNVRMPKNLISIGNYAFKDCSALISITIPDSVKTIGQYAFANCSLLTSITIPDEVDSIGGWAFVGCGGLETISVDTGNVKFHSNGNCLIATSDNTLILGCKESIIPDYVTTIGNYAFEGCNTLTSIIIPGSITTIGVEAFKDCSLLTSIIIPENVTTIGYRAFEGCSSLTSIILPNSISSIASDVFARCNSLVYNLKDNLKYLGNESNKYLYLAGVESNEIKTANIESGCKFIANAAFGNCSALKSIVIPSSVKTIGSHAFSGCSSLANVEIPDSITSIHDQAFQNCNSLTSITIPRSVTYVGFGVFLDCDSLRTVYCKFNIRPNEWHSSWDYECSARVIWG